ncbi:MAG: hypothetical protein N4A50_13500 [Vallitalea sp.]|jgi:hypothetical protein|nr:hypothetical protein [Vallitalea sp.]
MDRRFEAILAVAIGVVSIVLWLIPIVGIIVSLVGLFIGIKIYNSASKNIALAAIIINTISLILTVMRSLLVAYLT